MTGAPQRRGVSPHPESEERQGMRWEEAFFRTAEGNRYGSAWGRWGISHGNGRRYIVYLLAGARLTEFDRLRCARRFCERIDKLTDWSRPHAELISDKELGRAMHRVALNIAGTR